MKNIIMKAVDLIKNNMKKILIIGAIAAILIITIILIANKDVIHTKGIKIYYRTYTEKTGWSHWSKNGQINGKKNNPITAVQIKIKTKSKGNIFYNTNQKNKWQNVDSTSGQTSGNEKDNVSSIRIMLSDTLYNKYKISYRTNKKGEWSEWGYDNFEISTRKYINQIQIKVEERK